MNIAELGISELRERFHLYKKWGSHMCNELSYDPGCAAQYEGELKSYIQAYIDMGFIDVDLQPKDFCILPIRNCTRADSLIEQLDHK